jgi:twitching motility protein PilT
MSSPGLDLSSLRSSLSESGTFTIGDDLLGPDDDTLDPDSTVGDDSALGIGPEEIDIEQLKNAPKTLSFTAIDRSDVFKRPNLNLPSTPGPKATAPAPGGPSFGGGAASGTSGPGGYAFPAPTPVPGAGTGPQQVVVSQVSVPGVTMDAGRTRRAKGKLPQIKFTAADTERLHALLKQLAAKGGSDLHLKAGLPAFARINGRVTKIGTTAMSADQLMSAMASILTPAQLETYLYDGDLDLSIGLPGAGRFRINMLRSRGLPGLVARLIPSDVPTMEDLHLPPLICQLTDDAAGMILVTGPTGSGKSTTLAAVLDYINASRHGHIITVEDPVEFLHRDKLCTITQREVGTDAVTFAEGLQFANRMDPDVVMVGELRDIDTIRAAFHAAGAGRLVLATVHTNSAAKTVERIISAFPADDQPQARVALSLSLTAVVSQSLIPASVGGRVPAHEIMIATGAIRKAIRENNTTAMYNQIESGAAYGMVTLEQSLVKLYKAGKITKRDALRWASDPQMVENLLD